MEWIEPGYQAYLSHGGEVFGAIRQVGFQGQPQLIVYVEGGGDYFVPLDAVASVSSGKVIFHWDRLPPEMQEAIRHAGEAEDFPPPDEGEVELVPPPPEEDDPQDDSWAPRYDGPV